MIYYGFLRVIFHNKLHRVCLFRCLPHLLFSSLGTSIEYVLTNRSVDQERLLPDHADFAAQVANVKVSDVDAIDCDDAAVGFVKAQQEIENSRLPAARLADESKR